MRKWLDADCVLNSIKLKYPDASVSEEERKVHGPISTYVSVHVVIKSIAKTLGFGYYSGCKKFHLSQCRFNFENIGLDTEKIIKECSV